MSLSRQYADVFRQLLFVMVLAISGHYASAQITGAVTIDGTPPTMPAIDMSAAPACANMHPDPVLEETVIADPKTHALKNVVVSIKHDDPTAPLGDGHTITSAATLDQRGCMFVPHVLAITTSQPITIRNSDDCNHSVHSLAQNNDTFSFDQPPKDVRNVDPQKAPENFQVKCNVHPWMNAWICVFDHPYFAVTGADGKYSIDTTGLPDGAYTLVFWQEHYGSQEVKAVVMNHRASVDAAFKPGADDTP